MIKAYKFKIKCPSKAVVARFEQTLDLCRELYNAALQERRDAWKLNRINVSYLQQANQLGDIKVNRDDLGNVHSQILQDVLKRLDKTYSAFFSRVRKGEKAGFPRFKSANRYDSFCFPQSGFKLDGDKLTLSKIGKVKIFLSRPMVGKVKTCTIKREVSGWFAIFAVETTSEILPKTGKQIGIDAGIESFITLSDGKQIENHKYHQSAQTKLRVAQRSVSRKIKGSNSQRKSVFKLKKIYKKIRNQKTDFAHKVSTELVKEYDLIAIEKLNILGLSKGILSKQIRDAAWGNFFLKLKYKAENAGKSVIEVNPSFTSQDCSSCGERVKKGLSIRVHHCQKCGLKIHRDVNAAINILSLGKRDLALNSSLDGFAKESSTH